MTPKNAHLDTQIRTYNTPACFDDIYTTFREYLPKFETKIYHSSNSHVITVFTRLVSTQKVS
jgi:hypothetical protein